MQINVPLLSYGHSNKMAASMEQEMDLGDDFPDELQDRVVALDTNLSNTQKVFEPLISTPLNVIHEKVDKYFTLFYVQHNTIMTMAMEWVWQCQ